MPKYQLPVGIGRGGGNGALGRRFSSHHQYSPMSAIRGVPGAAVGGGGRTMSTSDLVTGPLDSGSALSSQVKKYQLNEPSIKNLSYLFI